jgi:L-rhamnose mutarotase
MNRYMYVLRIRPGTGDAYVRAHDEMPERLRTLYRSAGMRNYSLFMNGEQVIAYCECEGDPVAAFAAVARDPLEQEFTASLDGVIVELPADDEGVPVRVDEVWHVD